MTLPIKPITTRGTATPGSSSAQPSANWSMLNVTCEECPKVIDDFKKIIVAYRSTYNGPNIFLPVFSVNNNTITVGDNTYQFSENFAKKIGIPGLLKSIRVSEEKSCWIVKISSRESSIKFQIYKKRESEGYNVIFLPGEILHGTPATTPPSEVVADARTTELLLGPGRGRRYV